MKYDLVRLTRELCAAGLPCDGVSGTKVGRMDFSRDLTPDERTIAEKIKAAHDPTPTDAEARADTLRLAGHDEARAALILVMARGDKAPVWARDCVEKCAAEIEARLA